MRCAACLDIIEGLVHSYQTCFATAPDHLVRLGHELLGLQPRVPGLCRYSSCPPDRGTTGTARIHGPFRGTSPRSCSNPHPWRCLRPESMRCSHYNGNTPQRRRRDAGEGGRVIHMSRFSGSGLNQVRPLKEKRNLASHWGSRFAGQA